MSGKDPSLEIRRPRPRTVEEFVEGPGHVAVAVAAAPPKLAAVPATTELRSPAPTSTATPRRGVAARAKGEAKGRLTVYVDLDVAAKLRRHCFEQGLELSGECERAISEYVARLMP